MKKPIALTLAALAAFYLGCPTTLTEDGFSLAQLQYAAAKRAFNRQDYFRAQRLANCARLNRSGRCLATAGPLLLPPGPGPGLPFPFLQGA